VDALFACQHAHVSFRRLAGALSAAGDLCFPFVTRPRRRGLTPAKATLFSTIMVPRLFHSCFMSCPVQPHTHVPVCALTPGFRTCSRDPHGTAQEFASVSPISPRSAATANPNTSAHVCSPKPSDARSNHLGRLDPHHLPALAWSPLSFLCTVTVAQRRCRVVAMATPQPFRPTAVAWMPARTHVPVPTCATMCSSALRGQGQAFGSLSRLTSLALRPATGRGFAADGKSFLPGSASANSILFLCTRSGARARQPGRRLAHLERN
jgi:hypothetical protein